MHTSKSKNKTKINWLLMMMGILFLTLLPTISQAADEQTQKNDPATLTGFSYNLVMPENQVDENLGYYKLKVTPGQKQTVILELSNPMHTEVKVDLDINSAKTNINGVIEYGTNNIPTDPSLKYDIKKLIEIPKQVTLQPGETQKVEMKLKVPETTFDGMIAGAIQIMKAKDDDEKQKTKGTMVVNRYAYNIGFFLIENEEMPEPDLKLNKVYADQNNGRNTIFVNYSNIMPSFVNDMTTEVQITPAKGGEVLYETKKNNMRMAPNTFIDFPVSMNGEAMESGNYKAKILVTSTTGRWEWTKEFKITKEQAEKFNERDVGLVQEKGINWKAIIWIVLAFIILLLIIFMVIRWMKKKKKKHRSSNKKSKSER